MSTPPPYITTRSPIAGVDRQAEQLNSDIGAMIWKNFKRDAPLILGELVVLLGLATALLFVIFIVPTLPR